MSIRLSAMLSLSMVACASIDAPIWVPPDYAARETAKIDPWDSCGPEFLQDALPGWLVDASTPLLDGPFRPVCERHDACYGLEEYSQTWCDDRMRQEMFAICDSGRAGAFYSAPLMGSHLCRRHAGLYFGAINTTLGAFAYGDGDKVYPPGGHIESHKFRQFPGPSGRAEVEVCVSVLNDTMVMQEYDVELRTLDGQLIDREPDLHHRNVRAGDIIEVCLDTVGPLKWTAETLPIDLVLTLRADRPDSFMFNDVVETVEEIPVNYPKE